MSKSFFTHSSFVIRHVSFRRNTDGFTLIEVLVAVAVFAIVAGSTYVAYGGVLEVVQTAQLTSSALSIMESRLESIRNMRYEDIGTVGGIPNGALPQQEEVTLGNATYTLGTFVREIDDPFDGTLQGTPADLTPADYKLVQLSVTCTACSRTAPLSMATYIAPKTLEDASKRGSLLVQVIDASGILVPGATVHITNPGVSPAVDYTDTTDVNGQLWLLSVATSSAGYRIEASKEGYSTARTYAPGNPANPLKPDATVAAQQLTVTTLAIDRVSTLALTTRDKFCRPVSGFPYSLTGNKLIGTAPDVPKYTASRSTGMDGTDTVSALEWDAYHLSPLTDSRGLAGISASLSVTINPATTAGLRWVIASRSDAGLLVRVLDESGSALDGAQVSLTGPSSVSTRITGQDVIEQHDWSGGAFTDTTPNIGVTAAGAVTLLPLGGPYATASADWMTSLTYDLGTSSTAFDSLAWSGSIPAGSGPQSVRMQIAGNTDDLTWFFVGPDGTAASYFTGSGAALPGNLDGARYLRYRLYLSTEQSDEAPVVGSVSLGFSSECLPDGQVFFDGLQTGQSYTLEVSKQGHTTQSAQLVPSSDWQQTTVILPSP